VIAADGLATASRLLLIFKVGFGFVSYKLATVVPFTDYIHYYNEDRTHLGLAKQTPAHRMPSTNRGKIIAQARLGGLHYRYRRAA
jgi:hypothetical protein